MPTNGFYKPCLSHNVSISHKVLKKISKKQDIDHSDGIAEYSRSHTLAIDIRVALNHIYIIQFTMI